MAKRYIRLVLPIVAVSLLLLAAAGAMFVYEDVRVVAGWAIERLGIW